MKNRQAKPVERIASCCSKIMSVALSSLFDAGFMRCGSGSDVEVMLESARFLTEKQEVRI
jgi:hypothetical protein